MTAITFPTSPTNGQSFTANGINYIWNSTRSTWSKQSTTTPPLITGHVLPDTTLTYDLGSATHKFKDLYMDGNTLHLGDETIKSGADGVEFAKLKVGHGGNTVKFEVDSTGKLKKERTKAGVKQAEVVDVESVDDLSDVDITTSAPTDGQALVWDNANSKFIPGDAGGGTALVGITSIDTVSAQTIVDEVHDKTYNVRHHWGGVYNLTTVDEGTGIFYRLDTRWVASGTSIPYTITGISAADLETGSLTGNFTVVANGASSWSGLGKCSGTVYIKLANDVLAEGNETLVMSLDGGLDSDSVTVVDTSFPPPDVIDYEPSWNKTHIYGQIWSSGHGGNTGDYYRHTSSFTFNSAFYLSKTNFINEDQIVWLYFLGGGGGGQNYIHSNSSATLNAWRFGGSGGCAMIWVGRASDFHGCAITIGAGGAAGSNQWRGGHSTNSSINLGGTIYNTNSAYNGARVWNPNLRINQQSTFTGPNFQWPTTGSAYPNLYSPTSRGYATYLATNRTQQQSVWGQSNEGDLTAASADNVLSNRTFGGGRGAGSGTISYSGTGLQGTSRYAGDGYKISNYNPGGGDNYYQYYHGGGGGCGKPTMTTSANNNNAHQGANGNLRVYWG